MITDLPDHYVLRMKAQYIPRRKPCPVVSTVRREPTVQDDLDRVYACINRSNGVTVREIVEATGITQGRVEKRIGELKRGKAGYPVKFHKESLAMVYFAS